MILRALQLNVEESEVENLIFFGLSLVRAQTWWTIFLTCGASPERYGAIYQHMEPKNVFFDHFWAKIMIFTYFDRALEARARRRNFWYFFVIENDAKGRLIPNFRFPAQATTPELRWFCMDLRKKFHLWFLKNIGKISSKFPCFSWKFKFFDSVFWRWARSALGRRRPSSKLFTRFEYCTK